MDKFLVDRIQITIDNYRIAKEELRNDGDIINHFASLIFSHYEKEIPFERIKELGSASVPFTFDIHSFIFSDDAVGLEQKLHNILEDKRVNKINLRKEFFKVSIDELEELVNDIDPSAEFNKTMIAEEYHQSLSLS